MNADGIVFATLAIAALAVLSWLTWRRFQPPPIRTGEEQRSDTWTTTVAHHMVDATSKSGRTPWL